MIEVSISEAKMHGKGNLRLGPGLDTVSVEQTPATIFYDAFTQRFLHFGLDAEAPVF